MRQFVIWHSFRSHYGTGSWAVLDGIVTVRAAYGTRTAMLAANEDPETTARALLRDLAIESGAKERGFG